MKTTELAIESMHCTGCARTVETLLSGVAGVRKVEVSFEEARARILHDPNAASATDLAVAVQKGGFKARSEDA